MKRSNTLMAIGVLVSSLLWSVPAQAGWSTSAMSGDADSGISTNKTYTHAVDLGADTTALTINGVPFYQGGFSGTDATHGGSYLLTGLNNSETGYDSPVMGEMYELLEDFYHNGDPSLLYLNGLETGSRYVTRFYVSGWGSSTNHWTVNDAVTNVFSVGRDGGHSPGAIISYEGTAQAGGLLAFRAEPDGADTFHFMGFTVEEAATENDTALISDLFNTGVDAQGRLLGTGAADPHYTIAGPQLPGTAPQAMVTVPNAAWNSGNEPFSRWIGPANGNVSVAVGTYTYTTTFTIDPESFPSTAQITGHIFADDINVSISLNGVRALTQNFHWDNDDAANDGKLDVVQENANFFTIVDGQDAGDGPVSFQTGQNTLVFSVPETGPFQGFRTYGMKGTVSASPPDPVMELDGSLTGDSVGENLSVGTLVGSFSVANTNATFTYSLVESGTYPDNASFSLSGGSSSNLVTAAVFDYETKTNYSIRVLATEAGPGSLLITNTFAIGVNNEVESWGGVYALATVAPGETDVGTLAALPGENTNVTYSVLAGHDAAKFEITGAGADTLALTNASLAVLDAEYFVEVQAVGTPLNQTNSVLIKVTVSDTAEPNGTIFMFR